MTTTQIAYWNMKATRAHYKRMDKETNRHNVRTEKLSASDLKEKHRHNVKTENLSATDLAERQRHNLATEDLTAEYQAEQARHNRETESISRAETEIKRAMTESDISVNNSRIALNEADVRLKDKDLEYYTIGLLLKSNKIGKNAAVAEILGKQTINSLKGYVDWVDKNARTYDSNTSQGNSALTYENYVKSNSSSGDKWVDWYNEVASKLDIFDWSSLQR
jgi:altronate dehydratase